MLDTKDFDPTRPLVLARATQVNGHQLSQRDAVTVVDDESDERGELTSDQASRLWAGGVLIYADRAVATPVETPEQFAERTTEVDDLGKGKFMIRAPWIDGAEFVDGDKLPERLAEVIKTGAEGHRELIDDVGSDGAAAIMGRTDGFSVEDKGSGNYEITGPGLDEPLKIRGLKNTEDKLAELRTAAAQQTSEAATTATSAGAGTAEVRQPAGGQGGAPVADPAAKAPAQTDGVTEPPTV